MEQDEPWADNRARKPHYEEGFTGGKGNPTKRDPPTRKEQGGSRTRNPNAPSDSDRVPSARRSTRRTVGRESEKPHGCGLKCTST